MQFDSAVPLKARKTLLFFNKNKKYADLQVQSGDFTVCSY